MSCCNKKPERRFSGDPDLGWELAGIFLSIIIIILIKTYIRRNFVANT